MALIKFTLGQNWTQYYNLYGMSPKFWDALAQKGWSKIDEYHKIHSHKVTLSQCDPMQQMGDQLFQIQVIKDG